MKGKLRLSFSLLSFMITKPRYTSLTDNCWFFKNPRLQAMTVDYLINHIPNRMIWVYQNLAIYWDVTVIEAMEQRHPSAVKWGSDYSERTQSLLRFHPKQEVNVD